MLSAHHGRARFRGAIHKRAVFVSNPVKLLQMWISGPPSELASTLISGCIIRLRSQAITSSAWD